MTRYLTLAALIERQRRARQLARVSAIVALAALVLLTIALPIGWVLTW